MNSQIILVLYFWSIKSRQKTTAFELVVDPDTISSYFNTFREFCIESLQENDETLENRVSVFLNDYNMYHKKYGTQT